MHAQWVVRIGVCRERLGRSDLQIIKKDGGRCYAHGPCVPLDKNDRGHLCLCISLYCHSMSNIIRKHKLQLYTILSQLFAIKMEIHTDHIWVYLRYTRSNSCPRMLWVGVHRLVDGVAQRMRSACLQSPASDPAHVRIFTFRTFPSFLKREPLKRTAANSCGVHNRRPRWRPRQTREFWHWRRPASVSLCSV